MSGRCTCPSNPLGGADNGPSNPSAGFEDPLRGGRKRGKGRNEEKKEIKEMDGLKRVGGLS